MMKDAMGLKNSAPFHVAPIPTSGFFRNCSGCGTLNTPDGTTLDAIEDVACEYSSVDFATPQPKHPDIINARITGFGESHCTFDCERGPIIREYDIGGGESPREEVYQYKYALDVDGNTFSGRYLGLGDDILLNILALCDVYTVVAVSAIDKRLRDLTQAKQLWLSLLQEPTFRDVLELRPPNSLELQNSSTRELVDLVKRAVIGPPPWWPGGPSATRTPAYTIAFHTGITPDYHRLLPGARYMFASAGGEDLAIYEVWSSRCIWKIEERIHTHTRFAIDVVPGGTTVRVLLASPVESIRGGYYLYVEEIDLRTGASHEVFRRDFVTRLKLLIAIVGEFFLYSLRPSDADEKLALVNWRASTYVVLNYGTESNSSVVLTRGYIVATHLDTSPPYQQLLTVTDLDAFTPHWQPLTTISLSGQLYPDTIPITAQERLEYNGHPLGVSMYINVRLYITPSAVYRGASAVIVYVDEFPKSRPTLSLTALMGALLTRRRRPEESARATLFKYWFRPPLPPGHPCGLRLVSAQLAAPGFHPPTPPRALMKQSGSSFVVSYYQ
ncbi:hypothetical protein C8R45DRAFT_1180781 [Mycena sanguinolenta]|nr:hypothetical protein C8R45DRAFT_1180781 [Mycena sanguinolenta]